MGHNTGTYIQNKKEEKKRRKICAKLTVLVFLQPYFLLFS